MLIRQRRRPDRPEEATPVPAVVSAIPAAGSFLFRVRREHLNPPAGWALCDVVPALIRTHEKVTDTRSRG